MRLFGVLATVLILTSAIRGASAISGTREHAAESQSEARNPILLELFTSEGCSSCPPVDDWVRQLDSSQPIPGAQIIVLSEHVDYWDHDGWKDPYSSASLTERQSDYVRGLRLSDVYTPQLILNGSSELHLNNPQQVQQAFQAAAAASTVSVRIDSVGIEAGKPGILQGHVEADAKSQEQGEIYIATALDHAQSQVLRGENSGRQLTHVAVVEEIVKIGKLEKGKSFDGNFQVKLKPGSDLANLRVIAFVQEPNVGKVLGAAMEKGIR